MGGTRIPRAGGQGVPPRLKPRKLPAQSRSRALVDAVVEAGARVLVDKGFEALTMQAVAERAGVSPGSLYQYFPDKAALVTELIERLSRRELEFHLARFGGAPAPAMGLEASLRQLFGSLLEFQAREGVLMRRCLEALQHLGRYGQLAERAERAALGLRAILEAHRDELAPGLDLDLATHVLGNAVHSLTHDGVLRRPPSLEDTELEAALLRLALGYLKAPVEPSEG